MSSKKKVLKITLITTIGIIILGIAVFCGIVMRWANTTEFEMISQTHFKFIIEEGQVADGNAFINPQGEMRVLEHIDESIRLQIADYMQENNLKLKEGLHYVRKKVASNNKDIGTLNEHLKHFKFEKIEE